MATRKKKMKDEKVGIKVVMSASDEDLIRLGVRTIGDRIRLRKHAEEFTQHTLHYGH